MAAKQSYSGEYSSSSSDSVEVEWNESKAKPKEEANDWLDLIEKNCAKNTKTNKKLEQKREQESRDQKVRQQRELNPYFRCDSNGGDGSARREECAQNRSTSEGLIRTESQSGASLSERNAINAKLLKAELMGNQTLVHELRAKLKHLESTSSSVSDRHKTKEEFYSVENKADEESMSLKEMYFREKQSTAEDETKRFVATTSKTSRYPEEEYEDMRRKHKKRRHEKNESKVRYVRHEDEDRYKCSKCLDNIDKQLVLANGEKTAITLTPFEPFVEGLCHILSKSHSNGSTISADEECLAEISERKAQICKFFGKRKRTVVFMETFFKRSRLSNRHLMIECIPIKAKYESEAKIFFKKAIMECEGEWAMNKQLIQIKDKPITKLLPKGLSYFWVTIGSRNDGFAHVIENEETFSSNFGKEIIGGLLDIEPNKWLKPKHQNYEQQYKRVIELKNQWNQTFS